MATTPSPGKRIVVLFSGSGTNLQALLDASRTMDIGGRIVAAISNRPNAGGLARAGKAGVETAVLDHRTFPTREAFDAKLMDLIDGYNPDLVVLAGFMRILSDGFVRHYRGRMLNIHPSLLPLYPGLNTHERALEAGDSRHGATVHFVTEELDGGPAVLQATVPVHPDDDSRKLADRVLEREHQIYPRAVQWFCEGRLTLTAEGAAFDGEKLERPIQWPDAR